jgi:ABC-type proline/glycine betaine transport system substrate-binding protein
MASVMLEIENGTPVDDAAKRWIDGHQDLVDAWIGNA